MGTDQVCLCCAIRLAACPVQYEDEKPSCHSVSQEWLFLILSPRELYLLKLASHGCAGAKGVHSFSHLFSHISKSPAQEAL